jgi:hypothetical protein
LRELLTCNLSIYKYTTFQLEWTHDRDYGTSVGGSGKRANAITAQIAIAFHASP